MELNREQIVKALEYFRQRILDTDLAKNIYEAEIMAIIDALSLIRELTKENKRLKAEKENLTVQRNTFREYAEKMQLFVESIRHKEEKGYEPSAARYAAEMDMWHAVALEKKELEEKIEKLTRETKADTVRKMQIKFQMYFGTYTADATIKVSDVFRLLDKFTEEMLEEEWNER
jgi:arginyl-tRNA--protein-N-Asp/Glu arginylyltransferase